MVVFVPNKSSDKTFSNMSEDDKDERHFSDDDENWTKLQDIASRRRIQNRISQRKRSMFSVRFIDTLLFKCNIKRSKINHHAPTGRRLKENSMNQNSRSSSTSPSSNSNTPKQRPEMSRSKTDFLERPHLHPHSRSRSTSLVSEFSLDGDNTPTQAKPRSLIPTTPEPNMPSWTLCHLDLWVQYQVQ